MKNLKNTLIIFIFFGGIQTACEGYLEKHPLDAISSETFWKTEADAEMALAGCYNALYQTWTFSYDRCYLDCLTDDCFAQWGGASYNMDLMSTGNLTSITSSIPYNAYYRGISIFNNFLANIDKVEFTTPGNKASYIAEVRFLRAFFYAELVNFYGDVIYFKELPSKPDDAKVAKSPKAEVLAFIEEDLAFAIENLPNTSYQGHAVKGSALALKARIALYESNWEEVVRLTEEIITDGKFSLAADYEGLFIERGQTDNPEIMFSTVYSSPDLSHNRYSGRAANTQFGWGSHIDPYWGLVDSYECIDGLPIDESPRYVADEPWLNRDPRLKQSIRLPNVTWPGGEPAGAQSLTGINMQKYVDLSQAPWGGGANTEFEQDYVHFRYADILMMYAEAKNEVSGPESSIYDAIDLIRTRPSVEMPKVDRDRYNSKESLREYIRGERRIEFALEGLRYFDLRRWEIAHEVLPKIKTPGGVSLVFESHHYLLPFPQAELDINPDLVQNPGY